MKRLLEYSSSSESDSSTGDGGDDCVDKSYINRNEPHLNIKRPKKKRPRFETTTRDSEDQQLSPILHENNTAVTLNKCEKNVQRMFELECQLFKENKITAQNAFELRLLDCINEMVNLPRYKSNMYLASSIMEVGVKTYSCRVDHVYSDVKSLASDFFTRTRLMNAVSINENQERDAKMVIDVLLGTLKKKQGITIKKRGRFVEADRTKLQSTFEQANAKFITRRTLLKKKFNNMLYHDLEFDYLSFTLEDDDNHLLETPTEMENLQTPFVFQRHLANFHETTWLSFLPFLSLPKFDPEVFNVWGFPINGGEAPVALQSFQIPTKDEFRYDPSCRPMKNLEKNQQIDPPENNFPEMSHFDNDQCPGSVSIHDIPNLDRLDDYYQRLRTKAKKTNYAWCGPAFVRRNRKNVSRVRNKWSATNPRVKKVSKRIDFTTIDRDNPKNQFKRKIARKTYSKVSVANRKMERQIPFLDHKITFYDNDFHPNDFQNEKDQVLPHFQLFTMPNRSSLDVMKVNGENGLSTDDVNDVEFDFDDDVGAIADRPRQVGEANFSSIANSQFSQTLFGPEESDHLHGTMYCGDTMIHFSKKPKPIDMSNLKYNILQTLATHLKLDVDSGQPLCAEETKIDLTTLMLQVLEKLDEKTAKLLSVSIFIFALLHVVGEKKLHVLYDDTTELDNPVVVCKGKNV